MMLSVDGMVFVHLCNCQPQPAYLPSLQMSCYIGPEERTATKCGILSLALLDLFAYLGNLVAIGSGRCIFQYRPIDRVLAGMVSTLCGKEAKWFVRKTSRGTRARM